MATKARGKLLRWYLGTGSPASYNNVVGYSSEDSISMSYSPESVPVTKDDASLIEEILPETGTVSITGSFSGSVDTTDVTDLQTIITSLYTGAVVSLRCASAVRSFSGEFVITSFELTGAREGGQSWSVGVQAASDITIA